MGSKKKVKVEISRGKYVESQHLKKLSFKRVIIYSFIDFKKKEKEKKKK